MRSHFPEVENVLTKVAFSQRVSALYRLVFNLFLFVDSESTAFANNAHKVAFIEFVGAKDEFIVSQLILALEIVAFKSNLIEVFLFQLIYCF